MPQLKIAQDIPEGRDVGNPGVDLFGRVDRSGHREHEVKDVAVQEADLLPKQQRQFLVALAFFHLTSLKKKEKNNSRSFQA